MLSYIAIAWCVCILCTTRYQSCQQAFSCVLNIVANDTLPLSQWSNGCIINPVGSSSGMVYHKHNQCWKLWQEGISIQYSPQETLSGLEDTTGAVHTPIQCEIMTAIQGITRADIMVMEWWLEPLHKSVSQVSQKSTFPWPFFLEAESVKGHGSTDSLFAIEHIRLVCFFPNGSEK